MNGITQRYTAYVMAFIGMAAVLSVALFSTSVDISSGKMFYQKLWLGRMAAIFVVCYLLAICLHKEKSQFFPPMLTWILIILGGIEAIWGVSQICGLTASNHSLYTLTGSFFNPGPYSGYLAMVFPLCLYEWLNIRDNIKYTWITRGKYYIAFGVMALILCILPAGMSRSAWVSVIVSSTWVYGMHMSLGSRLKFYIQEYKKKVIEGCIIGIGVLMMVGYAFFQLKAASANGRLFMWKINLLAIAKSPVTGYGIGNFVSAYGKVQEEYFASGKYSKIEELVAGSPEYAFNEYLQVAIEHGIPVLLLILLTIVFCLWKGYCKGRLGICGSVISVLVFAFSSYPMQIPGFAITFYFLLIACVNGRSKIPLLLNIIMMTLLSVYYLVSNQYTVCEQWNSSKVFYNIGAYQAAKKEYEKLYPELGNCGAFLFEYGHCLHKLKEYDNSTRILEEAMMYSNDPMILNIIGKNYQASGDYEKAEEYLIRSTHRLPGRIYPYYLLAKLYAEPKYRQPEKLKYAAEIVLTKEPKVQSTAVREMREEVKNLLK